MTHSTLTLEGLLANLAPTGIEKSAADVSATASADAGTASTETKNEPSALVKSAADAGAALAHEMMMKIASNMAQPTSAQVAGNALAQALLNTLTKQAAEKRAGIGDENTTNGAQGTDGTPTKIQRDNASLVAEHDASIKPMPTGDGIHNNGTATDIYNAVVSDMISQGGTPTTAVPDGPEVDGSGVKAVPNQVKTASFTAIEKMAAVDSLVDEGCSFEEALEHVKAAEAYLIDQHEKAAAVSQLIGDGMDFEEAAELVKMAGIALAQEEDAMMKQAALEELIANGVDFDQAIELIKKAGVGDENTMNGVQGTDGVATKIQRDNASLVAEHDASIKVMPTGDGIRNQGTATDIYNAIVQDMLAQGGTPTTAVPDGPEVDGSGNQAVPNQVKTASLKALVEKGFDFETASKLVKEAQVKAEAQAKQTKQVKAK